MIPESHMRNANNQDPLMDLAEAGHDDEFQKYIASKDPDHNLFNLNLVELALKKNLIEFKPEAKVCNILNKIFEVNPDINIPLSFIKKYCFTQDMELKVEFYRTIKSRINMQDVDNNEAYEYCKFAIESRVTPLFVDAKILLKKLNHLQIFELQKINSSLNKNVLTKKRIIHKCLQRLSKYKKEYIITHLEPQGLWIKLHSVDILASLILKRIPFEKFYNLNININKIYNKIFESIICPISQEIFISPIITPSGHTFDRQNILKLVKIDEVTKEEFFICPFTRSTVFMRECFNVPVLKYLCNVLALFYDENNKENLSVLQSKQNWMISFIEKVVYTHNYLNMLFYCWKANSVVNRTSYRFASRDEKLFSTVNISPEQKLYRFRLTEDLLPIKNEFFENTSEIIEIIKKITQDITTIYTSESDTDDDCKIVDTTTINQRRNKL